MSAFASDDYKRRSGRDVPPLQGSSRVRRRVRETSGWGRGELCENGEQLEGERALKITNIGTAVMEADYGSTFSRIYAHETATGFLVSVLFQGGVCRGC